MKKEIINAYPIIENSFAAAIAQAKEVFNDMDIKDSTRRNYQYCIGRFIEFMHSNGLNKNTYLHYKKYLSTVNALEIPNNKNKKSLKKKFLSVSTKNKYLITAKLFLTHLYTEGKIPVDITKKAKIFKVESGHVRNGLQHDNVKKIAAYIDQLDDSAENMRIKALFCLLAYNGIRAVECTRLNVENCNFKTGEAWIHPKSADDKRKILLNPVTSKVLQLFIKTIGITDGAIFRSFGNRNRTGSITTYSIQKIFKGIFGQLGITGTVHGYRHHAVTFLSEAGFSIKEIMSYTGHKDPKTVMKYIDSYKRAKSLEKINDVFMQKISFGAKFMAQATL